MAHNFYTTPMRQRTKNRATYCADKGYDTQKSREVRLPRGAKNDPILSGGVELMRLLEGQSNNVKANVITRVAALKDTPRVNTVRTLIIQEVQNEANR